MILRKFDKVGNFAAVFNSKTGFYIRSGIIDENKKDTGVDPFMCEFPELIDVGIMGHCEHGSRGLCIKSGVECYQSGLNVHMPNMTFEDFKDIVDQCTGRTFQFALGGRGDPDCHPQIVDFCKYSIQHNIVPNFTTSGLLLNDDVVKQLKPYVGAIAVSWYRSEYTTKAIKLLIDNGIKTNIHYVLSSKSIDEAIHRLENPNDETEGFPSGINAVIFLLHKPVGLGQETNMIAVDDSRLERFFQLIEIGDKPFKIGFDSCSVPAVIRFAKKVSLESVDTCEGSRFSCYISSDMKMVPCSFDQTHKYAVDLKQSTILDAWNSNQFELFRNSLRNSCPTCDSRNSCMGGCPIVPDIVLCDRVEKTIYKSE